MCANLFDAAETATKTHTNVRADVEGVDQTSAGRPGVESQGDCKAGKFQGSHVTLCCRRFGKAQGEPVPEARSVACAYISR